MATPIKPNIGTKTDFAARPSVPAGQKESSTEFNLLVAAVRANFERLILDWTTDIPINTTLLVGQYVLFTGTLYRITTSYSVGSPLTWNGANAVAIGGGVSDNIYTADGVLTGNRLVDGGAFELLFTNLARFDVESEEVNIFSFSQPMYLFSGATALLEAAASLALSAGTHINLNPTDELRINNAPGTAGQKLTTQGAGLPPIWGPDYFVGYYASLGALTTAHPSPVDGAYAFVDVGVGNDAQVYVWDTDDNQWVAGNVTTIANANTTTKGIVEEADQTETNAGTSTGGTGARLYVTPATLLALAATFANQLTFTTAPIVSSVTASQFLRSGASKEIVSVASSTQSQMVTGTDDVNPATAKSVEDKRSIKLKSFSNSATGSSTIDCLSAQEVTVFYNTTVTGAITIALSNDTNLEILNVVIPITGANIGITTPSTTRMTRYLEVSSGDGWYQSTKILQVSSIGTADTHELSFKRVSAGPTFNLQYDGPYRA